MGCTANALPHNRKKKEPQSEWIIEQPFLISYSPFSIIPEPEMYTVRKDNTISWKSNLYTLPIGSYKGQGTQMMVKDEEGYLIMADGQGDEIAVIRYVLRKDRS